MFVKKRVIAANKLGVPSVGFTVPSEIAIMVEHVEYFSVEFSGNSIVYTSGAYTKPTKQEMINYDFSGAKV